DLSKVLFIATANSLDTIHPALRDRMEIIEVTGYTLEEKVEIAMKHLVPKQLKEHGLKASQVKFSKPAIAKVVNSYTRESGVRNLERKIGTLVRSIAKSVALEEEYDHVVTEETVTKVLGAEIFDSELYQGNDISGVVTGLAWIQVGGVSLIVDYRLYL